MEVVLIDRFTVPEESKVTFLAEVRRSAAFLRTLPGFVEGFVYENSGGASHNVVTTAVWKDEDAFQNARKKAAEEFQRIGFNPPEIMKRLKVEIERGSLPSLIVLTCAWRRNLCAMNGHANRVAVRV